MGRIYEQDNGGKVVLRCRGCSMYLTELLEFISDSFHSSSGPALLFSNVHNVVHGKPEERHMMTGMHVVRDVCCKRCDRVLGWYYEFTEVPGQMYKEGCTILELAHIHRTCRQFS